MQLNCKSLLNGVARQRCFEFLDIDLDVIWIGTIPMNQPRNCQSVPNLRVLELRLGTAGEVGDFAIACSDSSLFMNIWHYNYESIDVDHQCQPPSPLKGDDIGVDMRIFNEKRKVKRMEC